MDVIKGIPEQKPTGIGGTVAKSFRTAPRMHEAFGTYELMLRPVWAAQDMATKSFSELNKIFKGTYKRLLQKGRYASSERIHAYAYSQQPGGLQVLEAAGKEVPTLTPNEKQMYDYMRGELEKVYVKLNEARVASGVRPFPKVTDYFTFFRRLDGQLAGGTPLDKIGEKVFLAPLKAEKSVFRFAKHRVKDEYGGMVFDALSVFANYMRSAHKHIYLTPQLSKINQLLNGKFYDGFRLSEANPEAYTQLSEWANHVAGVMPASYGSLSVFDRFARTVHKNLAYSVLSWNARTAGVQVTAIVPAMAEVGPKYALLGIKRAVSPDWKRFAVKHSNVLAGRQMDASISEAMSGLTGKLGRAKKTAGEIGIWPLQELDAYTANAVWHGAYLRARQMMGYTVKRAYQYADDIVVRTQASAAPSDVAPIQRTALGKLGTSFQTFVINNFDWLARDVLGISNPRITNKEAVRKVTRYVIGSQLVSAVFEGLGQNSPYPSPVQEYVKEYQKSGNHLAAAKSAAAEFAAEVPVIGGPARWGSPLGGAAFGLGEDLLQVGFGKPSGSKTLETLGKAAGVPGTVQMKKIIRDAKEKE